MAKYTKEQLAEAVKASATLSDAIRRLGVEPTRGRRDYVRGLLKRWSIDAGHLRSAYLRHSDQDLRAAASASSSVAEVVRRLGLHPVGGNQAHIGRRLADSDIDTSHFTSSGAHRNARPTLSLLSLGCPDQGRVPGVRLRKALLRTGIPEKCAECGTGPVWNDKPLRLEVDHVNGEWWDNRLSNLRLLCPNCHAVTDTYRGRKKRSADEEDSCGSGGEALYPGETGAGRH